MARPASHLTFQDNRLLDPAVQGMLLRDIKQMHGVGWQQDVQYGDVYKNGAYDWSKLDPLVNASLAQGMRPGNLTFRIYGTPAYQTRPGVDTTLSANRPDAVLAGKFAEAVAQHFKGRVGRYGVWNEPNIGAFINQNPKRAAATYAQIYNKMRASIKGVDPNSQVGFGEITSMQPGTKGAQSTLGFLHNVLSNSRIKADYLSIHPYQWSDPSKNPGNAQYGGVSNLAAIQQAIAHYAHTGRLTTGAGGRVPLTASEFGYKHDVGTAAQRQAWLKRSMDIFAANNVRDVNLYQLLPSKPGDYWDSSILGPQGQIPAALASAIRARARAPRARAAKAGRH